MEFVVGVSILSAILVFLSPGIAMLVVRSTVRYAPYSYALGLTSCALWIELGVHGHLAALWRLSSVGVLAYAIYLVLFIWNSDAADARWTYLLYLVRGGVAALLVGLALRIFASHDAYDNFCSAVSCFTALAPLWNTPTVYRTKSTASMPSVIVAGFSLLNAMISTARNTVGVETVNLNLAIPSGVALSSALVQVLLHLVCRCLPRPLMAPPPPQPPPPPVVPELERPLLQHQAVTGGTGNGLNDGGKSQIEAEAGRTGHGLDDSDAAGRKSAKDANERETRVDIKSLEEVADAKNVTIDTKNLPLPGDNKHEEIHHANEVVDTKNLTLPQESQHDLEDTRHAKNDTISLKNLRLPQDGKHDQEDKNVIDIVPVKPAQVVASHDCSPSMVDEVDTALPGEKA